MDDTNFWGLFFAFSWVWIPIVAILVGGFTEWLKFRDRQRQLGTSTHELEETVAVLEAQIERDRAAFRERLEVLEAIVTSQAWDALPDAHAGDAAPRLAPPPRVEELDDAARNERDAARLARRVRG